MSINILSQVLPSDLLQSSRITHEEFGSGIKYNFDEGSNDRNNNEAFTLWLLGDKEYKIGNNKLAKKYLVEFIDREIVGVDMNAWISNVSKFRQAKYYASIILKGIYYQEKNYKRSFYYYNKANKEYAFGLRCGFIEGNISGEDIYLFDCYEALENDNKAIEQVLGKIFLPSPADQNIPVRLYNLIIKSNNKEFLKYEMSHIFETINTKSCTVKFLNTRVYIPIPRKRKFSDEEKNTIIEETIKSNQFYKLIMEN